jgi:hypothetical protein
MHAMLTALGDGDGAREKAVGSELRAGTAVQLMNEATETPASDGD